MLIAGAWSAIDGRFWLEKKVVTNVLTSGVGVDGSDVAFALKSGFDPLAGGDGYARAVTSLSFGMNSIVSCAGELLYFGIQLKNGGQRFDLDILRAYLVTKVEEFEAAMRGKNVRHEHVIGARYVMCTFVDELIAGSAWGAAWSGTSLLVHFHKETWGGEKFFHLLERLQDAPRENRDLLELMYVCLCYGFAGRYLVIDGGMQQHEAIRRKLGDLLRQYRPAAEGGLSSWWEGVGKARYKVLAAIPVWVVAVLSGVLLLLVYLSFSLSLSQASDPVFGEIQSLRVKTAATSPQIKNGRFSRFLEREIREGLVSVADYDDRSVVTILGDSLFDSGSKDILVHGMPVLQRIALELKTFQGSVVVTGHTDNRPIRTLRFPSNWELSKARAEAVGALFIPSIGAQRVEIRGSADAEPVVDNATPEGRAKNRRVVITVYFSK